MVSIWEKNNEHQIINQTVLEKVIKTSNIVQAEGLESSVGFSKAKDATYYC